MNWPRIYRIATLPFVIIGVLQIAYWVFGRSVPVEIVARAIRTTSVVPGGNFEYVTYFKRSKYCDATVKRWFVDSDQQVREIEPLASTMRTEHLNVIQRNVASIPTPSDMPPGLSKSCYQATWACNPPQRWGLLPPIVGPETCLDFLIKSPDDGATFNMTPIPHGFLRFGESRVVTLAETWP